MNQQFQLEINFDLTLRSINKLKTDKMNILLIISTSNILFQVFLFFFEGDKYGSKLFQFLFELVEKTLSEYVSNLAMI